MGIKKIGNHNSKRTGKGTGNAEISREVSRPQTPNLDEKSVSILCELPVLNIFK